MTSYFIKSSLLAMALLLGTNSMARPVYTNVQCWAEGHNFRVNGDDITDNLASSRLFLKVVVDKENTAARILSGYVGHVSGAKFVDGLEKIAESNFYSQFYSDGKKGVIESSLSPGARKYKDDKYFRFRDFSSDRASYHDGGDMNGTLVISKDYEDKEVATFPAHYIFKHGDHTGGTMDFTCARD